MQLIIVLGLISKLVLVSGDGDVGKTVQDFDFEKVSSDMLKGFLHQAINALAPCYQVQFLVCSKILSVDRGIHSTMTSLWIVIKS
jgi:hypothetical protein